MFRSSPNDTALAARPSTQLRAASWISVTATIGMVFFLIANPAHSGLHAQIVAPAVSATA